MIDDLTTALDKRAYYGGGAHISVTNTFSPQRLGSPRRELLSASTLVIGACSQAGAPPSGATIARLDETTIDTAAPTRQIEALTRAANVHGLTVTNFNDAEPVYSRAFGFADVPAGKPLRTGTEIYGASLSKAVFSVLVMKLVEQGVLDLDKPLQEYVRTHEHESHDRPPQLRAIVEHGQRRQRMPRGFQPV